MWSQFWMAGASGGHFCASAALLAAYVVIRERIFCHFWTLEADFWTFQGVGGMAEPLKILIEIRMLVQLKQELLLKLLLELQLRLLLLPLMLLPRRR